VSVVLVQTSGAACAGALGVPDGAVFGAAVPGGAAFGAVGRGPAGPAAAGLRASGKATFYAADGGGNCSFDKVSAPLVVALGPGEYRAGASCGSYLDVSGPKGSVRVKVTDQCPECAAGHIDLSREAFERIGNPVDGIIPITYQTVRDPAVPGPVTVRVKEGSSQYWLAVRIDNHGNALTSVELQSGGGSQKLTHTDFNYWIDENGAGSGPFTLRLTDSTGRQVTVPGVKLSPETVQRTSVTMYSGAAAAPRATTAAPSSPAGTPSAVPSSAAPSESAPAPSAADLAQAAPAAVDPTSDSGRSHCR
jgi:expansin (peptidoglycan-binding protein)